MKPPRDRALVAVLAYAGLRQQEAIPLQWGDVGHTIAVSRTLTAGQLRERTETGKGRSVEIVAPLAEDLFEYRPADATPDSLLFPATRGGLISMRNWRERIFHPACEAAGVPARPYDLRHSFVSALVHEGRSSANVALAPGHSIRMCEDRYAHAFSEARLERGTSLEDAIREVRASLDVPRLAYRCGRFVGRSRRIAAT